MPLFACAICRQTRSPFKAFCGDCTVLFAVVKENLGKVGLTQLIDALLQTGIAKENVKVFLEVDQPGRGSVLDQITAALTNDLATGIGVKECDMSALDVQRIRKNPVFGSSTKPIDS